MRRLIFLVIGALELVVVAVLVRFACQIPSTSDVDETFQSAELMTERAAMLHRTDQRKSEEKSKSPGADPSFRTVSAAKPRKANLDLTHVLPEADRLKEVADSLRKAQTGLDAIQGRWPELRTRLKQLAG